MQTTVKSPPEGKLTLKDSKVAIPDGKNPNEDYRPKIRLVKPEDIISLIRANSRHMGIITNVLITPGSAKAMLEYNQQNRTQSKMDVAVWTETMDKGQWMFNGDVIRFSIVPLPDTDDFHIRLIDGQHTLQSIINSEKPQVYHIQCGLPEAAQATINVGRKRSLGDTLSMAGVKNPNVAAGAIRAYIYFKTKQTVGGRISGIRVTNQTMLEWINSNQIGPVKTATQLAVNYYNNKKQGKFLTQTTWAFLHLLFSKIKRDDAAYFLDHLRTGEDLSRNKNTPIYLLREKLLALQNTEGTSAETRLKYVMTAWNHYRAGEKPTALYIDKKTSLIPKPI